ncbi:MAG: glutathione S-transferase N-terminal domain-containing protein [Chrysiogenetes bacterium]|nr:glutathione S-transferase N-terminal domain-containing protein [Chrysiogenetes bacterium]
MNSVKLYTTPYCPFCNMAKSLLKRSEIPFEDVNVSNPSERAKIREQSGWPTVPVIYIGDELVGGFDELQAAQRSGKLDELLGN